MKILKMFLWLAAAVSMTFLCGCTADEMEKLLGVDKPKEALFVLSFHRPVAYPRGDLKAEQMLRLPNGKTCFVERYPMASSHNIINAIARPIPGKEGFYRISLQPDQKGRNMWMQLTAQFQHEPVIVLLDGIFLGEFYTRKVSDGTEKWVDMPLDVDAARALNIVKFANDNYRFFNGGSRTDKYDLFPENSSR